MRFVSSIALLVCFTLSCVSAYVPLSLSGEHSFIAESAASAASRSSAPVAYGSPVVHLDLKANNKLDGQPRRVHTTAEGKHIETVDSVMGGCAQLDFSATVTVGAQAFSLIVDTGSTSMGVASSSCSCSPANPTYSPGSTASMVTSSTQAFYSKYGDGSYWYASGYTDMVAVGGSKAAATTFAAITSQSSFFRSVTCNGGSGSQSQGIMGFAGSQLAVRASDGSGATGQQWFAQYQQAAQVPDIFAVQMCVNSGDVWLGGYDNLTFSGELHWVNIQPLLVSQGSTFTISPGNGYYTVAVNFIGLTGYAVDSTSTDYQGPANVNTIVDSGTTLMILPTAAYNNIVNAITTNYNSQINSLFGVSASSFFANRQCYTSTANLQAINNALPTLVVQLAGAANGVPLNITLYAASSYVQQAVSNGNTYYCVGIADRGSTSTTNILGWSFMNQLIVAHDLRNLKVGFAVRTGCKDGSTGAFSVAGGETGVADAAIQGGSVTSSGAAGGGSNSGANNIFSSISGLSTTMIIIIVVAVIAGIIVLLALCWCCQSQKSTEQQMQDAIQAQQMHEFGKI